MADIQCTRLSERWLDIVLLTGGAANIGADSNDRYLPPADEQDLAIMEIQGIITNITTMPSDAAINAMAVVAFVGNAVNNVDFAGIGPLYKTAIDRVAFYISPDPLVLYRKQEVIILQFPDLDAGNTADSTIIIKCVRVRPVEGPPPPIQLVR